jgi:hypothetical protein
VVSFVFFLLLLHSENEELVPPLPVCPEAVLDVVMAGEELAFCSSFFFFFALLHSVKDMVSLLF